MGKIEQYLIELDDENLLEEVKEQLDGGTPPQDILNECQSGMVKIGEAFSAGEMFVSDLMMSGALFKDVNELLLPVLGGATGGGKGAVVIGTVKDDIHDIGKDIVVSLLTASGYDVTDVGVDADPAVFVKAVQDSGAKVVGLSCLLVSCYDSIKATVAAFEEAGIRNDVKIVIGGGPIDQHVVDYSGADAFGGGAADIISYSKEVYA